MFVDFSYVLLWIFFYSKTSYGTERLYMAHGYVSSAQVATCVKSRSQLKKEGKCYSDLCHYGPRMTTEEVHGYKKTSYLFRGTFIPFLCDSMVTV